MSLSERVNEIVKRYNISVSRNPMQNEDIDCAYYRQTRIFKTPLTTLTVNSLESLCVVSQSVVHYANRFRDHVDHVVDFPSHVLPILECHIDASTDSLFIRSPFGSSEENTSAPTLYTHISEGKWISEKIILRWTLQILKSIFEAHKKFLTFPPFDARDIFLLSDEFILAVCKENVNVQRRRDVRENDELRRQRLAARGGGSRGSARGEGSDAAAEVAPNARSTAITTTTTTTAAAPTTAIKFPPVRKGALKCMCA